MLQRLLSSALLEGLARLLIKSRASLTGRGGVEEITDLYQITDDDGGLQTHVVHHVVAGCFTGARVLDLKR